jgi:hypothetical protein
VYRVDPNPTFIYETPTHKKRQEENRSMFCPVQWLTPVILATWEAETERNKVRGQSQQIVLKTPISKINRIKWTGGVAQVVECLLSTLGLSSNSCPSNKNNNK